MNLDLDQSPTTGSSLRVEVTLTEIRVLIVDDNKQIAESISRIIHFEPDISVVSTARSGEEALEIAKEVDFEIVLMDINLPGMDGIGTTGALLEVKPSAKIIILTIKHADTTLIREAMKQGACDFLHKPPDGDELISSIRNAWKKIDTGPLPPPGDDDPPDVQGKVLSVYSGKGGVGCTLLATNMALLMNSEETPVVLIDGDLQYGDVSVFLNLPTRYSISDLVAYAAALEQEFVEDILTVHESGMRVLAAPPSVDMAGDITAEAVRHILEYLRKNFAYVVIDMGCVLDDATVVMLHEADLIVAVATPDIPSIKNMGLFFEVLDAYEMPREMVCLVLNWVDRKDKITSEDVAEHLKMEVLAEIPYDRQAARNAINRGEPFLLGGKTQPLAKGMFGMLGKIREKLVLEVEVE